MGEALSARKFADLVDRSNVYISRLVKEGKLPTDENGKIPKEEGLAAFNALGVLGYEVNRENAEKARAQSKKEAKPPSKPTKSNKKAPENKQTVGRLATKKEEFTPQKPREAQLKIDLPEDDEEVLRLLHAGKLTSSQATAAYNRWKAKEKYIQQRLKDVELQQAQKDLLAVADVEADAAAVAAALMDKLRSLPPRIAPLCEGRPAREIEGIIDAEINDALAALQKSRFAGGMVSEG